MPRIICPSTKADEGAPFSDTRTATSVSLGDGWPPARYAWYVVGVLTAAYTLSYIDRQILGLIKPLLDEQLGWTNEQFGLTNSFFQGAYALSLLIFGWLIDKYGTKIGYAASIFAWSLAALGHAFVNTISGFFVARVALGLGEGGNFPSAIKAVALWFPKRERATATAIFNSGANVGAGRIEALLRSGTRRAMLRFEGAIVESVRWLNGLAAGATHFDVTLSIERLSFVWEEGAGAAGGPPHGGSSWGWPSGSREPG